MANLPRTAERVFGFENRWDARRPWLEATAAAGLPPLSFHACRHGFATGLLSKRISPVAVAKRGGWKSVAHVFRTYGHDLEDEALTDVLVDAELTHENALSKKAK
jgi:integrase